VAGLVDVWGDIADGAGTDDADDAGEVAGAGAAGVTAGLVAFCALPRHGSRRVSPKNGSTDQKPAGPAGPENLLLPFDGILGNTIRRLVESRKEEKSSSCDIFEVINPL
jgi:hypothetical protein